MNKKSILPRNIILITLRPFLSLLVAGGVIGLLHHKSEVVAGILVVGGIYLVWSTGRRQPMSGKIFLLAGMVLTGFLGVQVEIWGTENGHWTYHDLPEGLDLPHWIPMAWMLAFVFLCRAELRFIEVLQITDLKKKLLLAAVMSIVLPTWGEIITINMGVWTYSWGLQFFGVPLVAVFLLMVFHMAVLLLFTIPYKAFPLKTISNTTLIPGYAANILSNEDREESTANETSIVKSPT